MKYLRSYIRKLILEGIKADEMSELAIVKLETRDEDGIPADKYFLIHPEFFQQIRIYHRRGYADPAKLAADKYIFGIMTISEVPKGEIGNCNGATGMVGLSAAQPGWGPTMYDIVMADNPGGIIADRTSVSWHAFRVWKYYLQNRMSDVHVEPLDWEAKPWTKDPADDCSWGSSGNWGEPEDFPTDSDVSWNQLMNNIKNGVPAEKYPETEHIKYSDWLKDPTNYVYRITGGPINSRMVKSAIQKGDQLLGDLESEGIYLSDDWWESLEYEFYRRQHKSR